MNKQFMNLKFTENSYAYNVSVKSNLFNKISN